MPSDSSFYNIEHMQRTFDNIYNNNVWNMGQNESKSGLGSTTEYTDNIKKALVHFTKDKIKTFKFTKDDLTNAL